MSHRHALGIAAPAALAILVLPRPALADGEFAEPPATVHVATETIVERPVFEPSLERDFNTSVFRMMVGPAGKLDTHGAEPGLFVATEFGRAPAGFRLEADWLGVGNPRGLAQYLGELTLDFGGRSRIHPVIGAGAGVARTSASTDEKGQDDPKHGATLGVGAVRTGVSFRLPFEETDARIALDVTGVFPAIRGADAPRGLTPWATGTVGVMIGF